MIEIITEHHIAAEPKKVWEFFADSANWPQIDTTLSHSKPGESLTRGIIVIRIKGLPKLKIRPNILVNEMGELCWRGKVPGFVGEHYFRAESDGEGQTRWVHGERFSGLLSKPILAFMRQKLIQGYERFNRNLGEAVLAQG